MNGKKVRQPVIGPLTADSRYGVYVCGIKV